jgi:hypothetical protein
VQEFTGRKKILRIKGHFHGMRKDAAVAPQRLRRKKYFNVAYVVVDGVGLEPMNHQDARLLFRLVSYRYLRGSTAITIGFIIALLWASYGLAPLLGLRSPSR